MKAAQALALFDGLDFVTPEHIQEIAVLGHRASHGAGPAGALLRRHRRGLVEEIVKTAAGAGLAAAVRA